MLEQYYTLCRSRKCGEKMAPKTGRPRKEVKKSVNIGFRLTEETANKLQRCADALKISRTEVVERGIDLVEKGIKK